MTLLITADEASKESEDAKKNKSISGQKIVDEEIAKVKEKLAIDKDHLLGLVNNEIKYATGAGRRKLVIDDSFFYLYNGKISYYDMFIMNIWEDCADKSGYLQRGEVLADEVIKRLTSKDLPLSERYLVTTDNRLSNIYRLIAFLKEELTKAGYQVKYKTFSNHKAIVVRW